jgi:poly(3-hydroxybutyrate) depolymerase
MGEHDETVKSLMTELIGGRSVGNNISGWKVDPKKVHIMGYSQGGAMAWRFACKYPELITSAAPLSANGYDGTGSTGMAKSCHTNESYTCFSGEHQSAGQTWETSKKLWPKTDANGNVIKTVNIFYAHGIKDEKVHFGNSLAV